VHIVILGCGRVGSALAQTMDRQGHSVAVIDMDAEAFRKLSPDFGGSTVVGIGFDRDTLIEAGIAEGARLIAGGAARPAHLTQGAFVAPTVFSDVRNAMRIAREEIFGPVLCILPYDSEEDAIAIANDQEFFVVEVPNVIDYGAFKLRRVNMIQCDGWNGAWKVRTCTTAEFLSGIMGDSIGSINPISTAYRQQQGITLDPPHPMAGEDLIVITHDAPTATPGSPTKHIIAMVELELQH
jgi:hypothetical protein